MDNNRFYKSLQGLIFLQNTADGLVQLSFWDLNLVKLKFRIMFYLSRKPKK
jgi:hypothetical protein